MTMRLLFVSLLAVAAAKPACDIGIVGAGAGGAYAAYRAAHAGRSVCIFEMLGRPGGRIHSIREQGPKKDLVVEAGAYRFAPKPVVAHFSANMSWRIDTPLTAAIIKELQIPTAIYNPNASQWDHGMHKIVDENGHDAGYLTFVERMLEEARLRGANVTFNARVVRLGTSGNSSVVLYLEGGEQVEVGSVILNLPQRPLIHLLRTSANPISSVFPRPLYDPASFSLMKLYVHYDDAWWRNDLNLVAGPFVNTEPIVPTSGHNIAVPDVEPAPLKGQYHDGDVRCDGPEGRCRGFLQSFYGGNSKYGEGGINGAIDFYRIFSEAEVSDPVVHLEQSVPHHEEALRLVHKALVEFHKKALDAANATQRVSQMRPTGAVMSIWDEGVAGINAGCHSPKRNRSGFEPPLNVLPKEALQPLKDLPIYVANEAYGPMNCFAEGSLAMAETIMQKLHVELPRSGWLSQELADKVLDLDTITGRPPTDPALMAVLPSIPQHASFSV